MRLVVNATSYGDPPGGAGLRAHHLFSALRGHELLFLLAEDTPQELVPPGVPFRRLPVLARHPIRRLLGLRLPREGDLLFTDHYPVASTPTVLTLHDDGGSLLRRALIRRHIRRAHGILAVSESVCAAWGVPATVIPNGFAPLSLPPPPPGPYLLLVDPGLPHKGAQVARELARAAGLPLVEKGRGVEWLEQREILRWIAGASAVLCPSTREGFGMVALEAMALGRPVVVADLPAFREICGDVAFYGDDIKGALEATPERLERGRERARRYTWAAAAARLEAWISRAPPANRRRRG